MAYEPRRTLLIGLSALAVVFAAALFPAAGLGTHPGGPVDVSGGPDPVSTPTSHVSTPTQVSTHASTDASTETPTETLTPTETPTETPGAGTNDGSGGFLSDLSPLALLGDLAESFGWLLLAGLLAVLALFLRGADPGTDRVELPLDVTLVLPFVVPGWVGVLSNPLAWLPTAAAAVVVLFLGFGASAGAVIALVPILAVALVLRGARPGTPRVDLPLGITLALPFVVPEWAGSAGTGVSRLTMAFVVSVSTSVTQLLDALGAAGRAVTSGLGIALGEGLRGSIRLLGSLPSALGGVLTGLAALPAAFASIPGALSTVGGGLRVGDDRPDEDARETAPDPERDEETEDAGPPSVEDAWVAMTELLPLHRGPSTTPAEFARAAADRGFPAGPITRLTRAFEDVAYGGYSPGERADAARKALARLRDRLGGDPR